MDSNFSLIAGRTDHHTSTHIVPKKLFGGSRMLLGFIRHSCRERCDNTEVWVTETETANLSQQDIISLVNIKG